MNDLTKKAIMGVEEMNSEGHTFVAGDVIYSMGEKDGKYHLSKIVKVEKGEDGKEIWHRILYQPAEVLPDISGLSGLVIAVGHVPQVATPDKVQFLTNKPVTEGELEGYNEYVKL